VLGHNDDYSKAWQTSGRRLTCRNPPFVNKDHGALGRLPAATAQNLQTQVPGQPIGDVLNEPLSFLWSEWNVSASLLQLYYADIQPARAGIYGQHHNRFRSSMPFPTTRGWMPRTGAATCGWLLHRSRWRGTFLGLTVSSCGKRQRTTTRTIMLLTGNR
jgi:hypothetical protein